VIRYLILVLMLVASPLSAGEMQRLGYGRLVTNDFLGDGQDRWQTGSVASSRVWGRGWSGRLPSAWGEVLEMRISGGIAAPENLSVPAASDRPFAGYLGLGLHTHYTAAGTEFAVGADLFATGPSTGLDRLQGALHDGLGIAGPSDPVIAGQVGDGLHPSVVVEVGRSIPLGGSAVLRPFVEGRAGFETLIRVGADLTVGSIGDGALMVRDMVTGQRYRTIRGGGQGLSYILGFDVARLGSSVLLPESRGYVLTDTRNRARAGVHWQRGDTALFYGLTWLGPEFEGQGGSQVVGSVRLDIRF
jgi:hypothetical protein